MSHSEAQHPTEPTACSSSVKMQQLTCNSPPEKDKETPEGEWPSNVETEHTQHEPENSNSNCVPWKLPALSSPSFVGKAEPSCPEMQPQPMEASPQLSSRSLSKQHGESQGNLLQFDRQALGRISTSPTLRRLRGSGWGTLGSLLQRDALDIRTWGSRREPADSPDYLSKSLPGNPKDSPHLTSTLKPSPRLLSTPESTLSTADSIEPQAKPSEGRALPMLQTISKQPLLQASLEEQKDHSLLSLTPLHPSPQNKKKVKKIFLETALPIYF